jgi:hypothetical protein
MIEGGEDAALTGRRGRLPYTPCRITYARIYSVVRGKYIAESNQARGRGMSGRRRSAALPGI